MPRQPISNWSIGFRSIYSLPMGRPKTYDRAVIAEKAMQLFWLHGYEATSTQLLVESMGVNRFSLYAEFGNKQGLYEAALALYDERVVSRHFARLEQPHSGLADIEAVLEFFASRGHAPGSHLGCMLCNVATDRSPHDPAARGFVQTYMDRIEHALANALSRAQQRGELRADVPVAEEAQYFTATLLGFFVLMRSQVRPELLRGAGNAARRHLHSVTERPPVTRATGNSETAAEST